MHVTGPGRDGVVQYQVRQLDDRRLLDFSRTDVFRRQGLHNANRFHKVRAHAPQHILGQLIGRIPGPDGVANLSWRSQLENDSSAAAKCDGLLGRHIRGIAGGHNQLVLALAKGKDMKLDGEPLRHELHCSLFSGTDVGGPQPQVSRQLPSEIGIGNARGPAHQCPDFLDG